jgi:3-methyladenine DNA glycosylase/8-oxoguanine DNA glycosylase
VVAVAGGAMVEREAVPAGGAAVVEREVVPTGPFRMPGAGRDGVMRRRGSALERLLHVGGEPVLVRAWPTRAAVRLRAEGSSEATAELALERMRFALGVDHDLRPFLTAFARDPLLGPILRRRPWVRPRRRPEPFEALAWAVCEQLIESGRAAEIERRLVNRHGPRSDCGLRDVPSASTVAGLAPAQLEACGLAGRRSLTLVRAAREVASGRADLSRHEHVWRRLRAISGIGPWTLQSLALFGQGRDDQIPAGDVAYLKLVGRLARLGRRATVEEVHAFFAPYAPYAGLAGCALVHAEAVGAFRGP